VPVNLYGLIDGAICGRDWLRMVHELLFTAAFLIPTIGCTYVAS
jgi:hypothetical protein